jgi:phage terminase large subunit-like protein
VRDNGGDPNKPGYDPSFLPVIYEATPDDDWTAEDVWAKANPNLGVSVSLDYLRRECKRAIETPSYQNTFKRLHLNIKTTNDAVFLDMNKWDALPAALSVEDLKGRPCFGAFDLSTTTDITAFVLLFPPEETSGVWHYIPKLFIPIGNARLRERRDRVPYATWVDGGHVIATGDNEIDYDVVRRTINEMGKEYNILKIARDRWNASQITTQLQGDGFEIADFGQGFASMTAPTKELERLVMAGKLSNDKNPAMRWMAGNTAVEMDAAGNLKPSKKKSTERIDGIVALVMALGIAIGEPLKRKSVYETRGVRQV